MLGLVGPECLRKVSGVLGQVGEVLEGLTVPESAGPEEFARVQTLIQATRRAGFKVEVVTTGEPGCQVSTVKATRVEAPKTLAAAFKSYEQGRRELEASVRAGGSS